MKLLRIGEPGHEQPALLDSTGTLRDLSHVVADLTPRNLSPVSLARLAALETQHLPVVPGAPRIGVPVAYVGKFIAIGMNYSDHASQAQRPLPTEPVIFTKAVSCLNGPNDDVMLPKDSTRTDWEVELGVVIGTTARYVEESEALAHVAGYCVVNDLTEREFQLDRGGTWDKGKGCDTFGPVGPWLVTADEVGNPQQLDLWLDLNGVRRQTGNTRTMIFSVATLIAYTSHFITLEPGDILTTGTPPGVGSSMTPPLYLAPGDSVRLGVAGLGIQEQNVVAWSKR